MPDGAAALEVARLSVSFARPGAETLHAVREASLRVAAGESLGLVGESGAGKTQLFLAAMGLLPRNALVAGSVRFEGEEILGAKRGPLNRIRGSRMTMVFQDPLTSLTPHLRIGVQLAEVLVYHEGKPWSAACAEARRMLDRVGIADAERRLRQYPHELSGGLRQRVMIGMSLMSAPRLLVADEPTTALDVAVQAQIVELLRALRAELGMSLVLISHDLALVAGLADRVVVMYAGRIVEEAASRDLLTRPRHPYTAALLACTPSVSGPLHERMPTLQGQPPSASESPPGCMFAPRCPRADERCRRERPPLVITGTGGVACHHPEAP